MNSCKKFAKNESNQEQRERCFYLQTLQKISLDNFQTFLSNFISFCLYHYECSLSARRPDIPLETRTIDWLRQTLTSSLHHLTNNDNASHRLVNMLIYGPDLNRDFFDFPPTRTGHSVVNKGRSSSTRKKSHKHRFVTYIYYITGIPVFLITRKSVFIRQSGNRYFR